MTSVVLVCDVTFHLLVFGGTFTGIFLAITAK